MGNPRQHDGDSTSAPDIKTPLLDGLQSWKEIAAFIGRDERTAMRWAKQGMPVHRTPGSRGRVYASPAEILTWLNQESQPPTETEPHRSQRVRIARGYLGTGILLLVLGIGLWSFLRRGVSVQPASVKFTLDSFSALGADGRVLWTHRFPAPLVPPPDWGNPRVDLIADLFGDGDREVLVSARLQTDPNSPDSAPSELDCFSSSGKLLWQFVPHEILTFSDREMIGPSELWQMIVSGTGKATVIYGAFVQGRWGISFISKIDAHSGRGTAVFVNSGTIHALHEVYLSGAKYLLVGGFNNEWDGGSLAVVNETRQFSASPQTAGTRYKCLNCPSGDPEYYFVFPRSELNRKMEVYETPVTGLDSVQNQIEMTKDEVEDRLTTLYLFQTVPSLSFISLRFDSRYEMIHHELEQKGELDHPLAKCPERLHPAPIRVWTPRAGWKEWQVPTVAP